MVTRAIKRSAGFILFQVSNPYLQCYGNTRAQVPTYLLQVGMSIDSQLFINRFPTILGSLMLLIGGKTLLVTGVGRFFGLSTVAAARAGLLLAPGGEFAFVAFGEAVNQASLCNLELNLVFINEFSCTTYFVLKIVSFVFSLQLSASCSTSV